MDPYDTAATRAVWDRVLRTQEEPKREQVAKPTATSADQTDVKRPVKKGKKIGPNDPCPCGSGKKFKKCHGMYQD